MMSRRRWIVLLALLGLAGMNPAATAQAPGRVSGACFETTIMRPTPFLGNHGEVFRIAEGSWWEVQYEYEYLYEYLPTVVLCPANGRLHINGKRLSIAPLR